MKKEQRKNEDEDSEEMKERRMKNKKTQGENKSIHGYARAIKGKQEQSRVSKSYQG